MSESPDSIAPVKKRGWPAGKPRGPRVSHETLQRPPQRAMGTRTRTGRISVSDDPYSIDVNEIPPGMSWQWIARTVMGKDDGKIRMRWTQMARNGWEPVDGARVPQFGVASGMVDLGGLVLCERPREMTDEAREEDYARAVNQVSAQMNRLEDTPNDQLPRKDRHGKSLVSVRRDREGIKVRADEAEYEPAGE